MRSNSGEPEIAPEKIKIKGLFEFFIQNLWYFLYENKPKHNCTGFINIILQKSC